MVTTLTEISKYLIINNNKIEIRSMTSAQRIIFSKVSPILNSMIESVFKIKIIYKVTLKGSSRYEKNCESCCF